MKDLLCVDGLDDVDSVYAGRQSVMIGFNVELAKSTHHPSEISKRSTGSRDAPTLLAKKAAIRKKITRIQLRNVKNFQSPIKFNGKLAKSTCHPSEISKRSSDDREAPALLAKKAAIRQEITKSSSGM